MIKRDPKSVYRCIRVRVQLEGYGTRASHIRDLNHLLRHYFAPGSKVIKNKP